MFDDLNENNILLYAAKCYDRPNCVMSEFDEDYRTIRYVKRILKKYRATGELKERLLLNHVVLLQNVFGIEGSTRILFTKVEEEDYGVLKTFLVYTSAMPEVVYGINGKNIISSDIQLDWEVVSRLRLL
jgi:hypothetical protein